MYYNIDIPESLANAILNGTRQIIVRQTDLHERGNVIRFSVTSALNSYAYLNHDIDKCRFKVEELYNLDSFQILRFVRITQ